MNTEAQRKKRVFGKNLDHCQKAPHVLYLRMDNSNFPVLLIISSLCSLHSLLSLQRRLICTKHQNNTQSGFLGINRGRSRWQ